MVQWFQNSIFINLPPLPMLCEISGPVHLAEPGLMAGRLADVLWQAGWQTKYR